MKIRNINKTFVKQHDQSDCGIACLASVIQYHGGRKSLETLRELSGTLQTGTTMLGLYQAAEKIGFIPEGFEANIDYLKNQKHPSIIHVITTENISHYLVCYGWKNDQFIIGDPAYGIATYSEKEIKSIWKSKVLLVLNPTNKIEQENDIKSDKKLWAINLIKKDIKKLSGVFILTFLIALLGLALAVFSQKLIDDILPNHNSTNLIYGLLVLSVILILKGALGYFSGLISIQQGRDFNIRLVDRFYSKLLYLPKSFFDNRRIGELVARLDDTAQIQRTIALIVGQLLNDALILIAGEIILFSYSLTIGLLSLIALPVFIIISFYYNKKLEKTQRGVMAANAHKSSNYINTMQGVAEIKVNNKEKDFEKQNQTIFKQYQDAIFHLGRVGISLQLITELAGVIIMISLLSFGAFQVYSSSLSVGELIAILTILGSIFPAISNLAFSNLTLQGAKVAFDRMYEFLSIQPENYHSSTAEPNFKFQNLEIQNLSFRFPGRKLLLSDVNLKISKGELIALFGESGGGKSTLLNILQRFYNPENGKIYVNENNFHEIPLTFWRDKIGVIPQEINIFNGTLIENICLNNSNDEIKKCIGFCNDLGFGKYFNEFPQGYATILGEMGINISGGQKQLLALARVLYKKPELLLLDEPTAAMDRNTENFVIELLHRFKDNMAVIVVTHRVKIARNADSIYILNKGICIENGDHNILMKSDNLYSLSYKEIV